MSLYTINQDLLNAINQGINPETGELENFDTVSQLQMERNTKIEHICLYIKDLTSEANAIAEEVKNLTDRMNRLKKKAEALTNYLKMNMDAGEKFSCPRAEIKWTSGESVQLDENILPKKYFRKKVVVEPDKAGIKTLLKQGVKIKGASLIKTIGMKVK